MLTLKNLFSGQDYKDVMLKNKDCEWDHLESRLIKAPPEARELAIMLLSKDITRRPDARQALKHKWFRKDTEPLKYSLNLNRVLADKNNPTILEIQSAMHGSGFMVTSPKERKGSVYQSSRLNQSVGHANRVSD